MKWWNKSNINHSNTTEWYVHIWTYGTRILEQKKYVLSFILVHKLVFYVNMQHINNKQKPYPSRTCPIKSTNVEFVSCACVFATLPREYILCATKAATNCASIYLHSMYVVDDNTEPFLLKPYYFQYTLIIQYMCVCTSPFSKSIYNYSINSN